MIKKNNNLNDVNKIKNEIIDLKKSLINFKFQKSTGQLEKTASIKKTRREIAKLKTKLSMSKGVVDA